MKKVLSLIRGLFRKTFKSVFRNKRGLLIRFNAPPPDELFVPDGYDLEIKEVRPKEVRLVPREIAIPHKVLMERWGQGSKMYGIFWEGKIVYYSWIFIGEFFIDKTDGFYLKLNPNEAYCFDYKGVSASCPKAFRSFRGLSSLIRIMLNHEGPRLGDRPEFFVLVNSDNKMSTHYHLNILKGSVVATMNLYRFLWWKWFTRKPH